ncbi:MAG: OsmC family protein [Anaerolineales bacterium]
MERTRLVWQEREQFAGIDHAGHALVLASEEGGGGVSPVDALLLALAGCTAVGVLRIMTKKRQPLTGLEVVVSADREPEPPQRFRTIGLHFLARGVGIEAGDLEQAIELADRKYCAVSGSLRPQVTITTSFEVNPDEGDR